MRCRSARPPNRWGRTRGRREAHHMSTFFVTSIDVNVPVRTAYTQWTQFEDFPHFMEGVKAVQKLGDRRFHWKAEIAGKEKEWDAEITEQTPNQRFAWRSLLGDLRVPLLFL